MGPVWVLMKAPRGIQVVVYVPWGDGGVCMVNLRSGKGVIARDRSRGPGGKRQDLRCARRWVWSRVKWEGFMPWSHRVACAIANRPQSVWPSCWEQEMSMGVEGSGPRGLDVRL